jgi:nanoRNase/pAp phosphatase (c-di-AMP/oligoRNAs hydrolase)
MSSPQTTSDLRAVADALRDRDRFLLVTHENPDGDALGSILAAKLVLDQLGKDAVMYVPGAAPLPAEYKFMPFADLRRELPEDAEERVLFALDCANESRLGEGEKALSSARSSSTSTTTTTTAASGRSTSSSPTPRLPGRSCAT